MKSEYLELRIEELEELKRQLKAKRADLDREIVRTEGKIEELWTWIHAQKDKGEFGHLEGGRSKVLRVPVIGNAADVAAAIEGRANAPTGENAEEANLYRQRVQLRDTQNAVDVMDGQGPFATTHSFLPPGTEPDAILYSSEAPEGD